MLKTVVLLNIFLETLMNSFLDFTATFDQFNAFLLDKI